MRVTLVSLRPTEAAEAASRPALTPELLAATGARYSRSNEGLESILSRIDPVRLDQSVDAIFRMIDYGHQSIADMAPVALFIDGISAWLAYLVWTLCPHAGGQESSTRYVAFPAQRLIDAAELGLPEPVRAEWQRAMNEADAQGRAVHACWQALADAAPERVRLPASLLTDPSERAARQVARLRRNFAFDRSRYLLPAAVATNMMLVMSARAWVTLCQHLCSHALPEARRLGEAVRGELALSAPRMLRHADAEPSYVSGQQAALDALSAEARRETPSALADDAPDAGHPAVAHLDVLCPPGVGPDDLARDLAFHAHRYAWMGPSLKRVSVRFGWEAVALAEIRDLNRHRTGHKHCPALPLGFYAAADQLPPAGTPGSDGLAQAVAGAARTGRRISRQAHARLAAGDPTYVYWTLLGTQFAFEHVTTADRFIYEAELRTGTGAHYRYAAHLHDVLERWYALFPATKGRVLEGTAEPE